MNMWLTMGGFKAWLVLVLFGLISYVIITVLIKKVIKWKTRRELAAGLITVFFGLISCLIHAVFVLSATMLPFDLAGSFLQGARSLWALLAIFIFVTAIFFKLSQSRLSIEKTVGLIREGTDERNILGIKFKIARYSEGEFQPGALICPVKELAILILLITLTSGIDYFVAKSRFEIAIKDAESKGLPTSLIAFKRDITKPGNAYPEIENAAEKLKWSDFAHLVWKTPNFLPNPFRTAPWSQKEMKNAEIAVQLSMPTVIPFISIVRNSSYFGAVDYEKASKDPWHCEIPKYSNSLAICDLIGTQATLSAYKNDLSTSWRLVNDMAKYTQLIAEGHTLISQMIAVADQGKIAHTMWGILMAQPKAVIPPDLIKSLENLTRMKKVEKGMEYELPGCVVECRYMQHSVKSGEGFFEGIEWNNLFLFFARKTGFFYLDSTVLIKEFFNMLPFNNLENLKNTFEMILDERRKLPIWPHALIVSGGIPMYTQMFAREIMADTRVQMILLVPHLEKFKVIHGHYPSKLSELEILGSSLREDFIRDPFSNGELIYKPKGKGYILYSVGMNGKDDGGDFKDDKDFGYEKN